MWRIFAALIFAMGPVAWFWLISILEGIGKSMAGMSAGVRTPHGRGGEVVLHVVVIFYFAACFVAVCLFKHPKAARIAGAIGHCVLGLMIVRGMALSGRGDRAANFLGFCLVFFLPWVITWLIFSMKLGKREQRQNRFED